MPEGLVRNITSYRDGFGVTGPISFGTNITEPHTFGIVIPVVGATFAGNPVTLPHTFGNIIAPTGAVANGALVSIAKTSNGAGASTPVSTIGATLLVAIIAGYNGAGTVTDSQSNVWTLLPAWVSAGATHPFGQFAYVINPITNAAHTFTITGAFTAVVVYAFSGTGTPAFDSQNGNIVPQASPFQTGSITPSLGDVVLAAFTSTLITITSATIDSGLSAATLIPGTGESGAVAYLLNAPAASLNPTWTCNDTQADCIPMIVSFAMAAVGTQATPTFAPVAGTYTSIQTVAVVSAGADAIYYTTDGSTPTRASTLYSAPVSVGVTETLKALAVKAAWSDSAIGSAAYTINLPVTPPTFVQFKEILTNGGSTTGSVSLAAPATTGNALLVFIAIAGGSTLVTAPVDDTGLNTYTLVRGGDVVTTPNGGVTTTYIYLCGSVLGTPQTVTFTQNTNATGGRNPVMLVVETTKAAVDDKTFAVVDFTGSAGDFSGGTLTSTAASDLLVLFSYYCNGNATGDFSDGTGWTVQSPQYADFGFIGMHSALSLETAGAAGVYNVFVQQAAAKGLGLMASVALKGG